jgi:hypothetical protein
MFGRCLLNPFIGNTNEGYVERVDDVALVDEDKSHCNAFTRLDRRFIDPEI